MATIVWSKIDENPKITHFPFGLLKWVESYLLGYFVAPFYNINFWKWFRNKILFSGPLCI